MNLMKTTQKSLLLLMILLVCFVPIGLSLDTGFSGNYIIPDAQSGFYEEQYEVSVSQKLQRGLENFFMSPLEIPHGVKTQMVIRKSEYLPVGIESVILGLFRGFGGAIRRAAVGLYEGVTCLYPQGPILEEMDEWLY